MEAKFKEDSDENIYNLDRHLDASIGSGVTEEFFGVDEPADHLGEQDEQPAQPTNAAVMLMITIMMMMAAYSRRKEEDSDETKGTWKKAEAKARQSKIHKHVQNEYELWTICCGEEIDVEVNVLDQKKENPKILRLRKGITIDSGAGNSVMPRRMVVDQSSIRESAGSKAGVHYVAANDGRIPNEGECDLEFQTAEGMMKIGHSRWRRSTRPWEQCQALWTKATK